MTADRTDVVESIKSLRVSAEQAGLVAPDPWASLDTMWKGPDVDLQKISAIGQETMEALRQAHAEGKADASLINQVLDLAKILLPVALAQL